MQGIKGQLKHVPGIGRCYNTRRSARALREPIKKHQMATRNSSAPAPALLRSPSALHRCADLGAAGRIPAILYSKLKPLPAHQFNLAVSMSSCPSPQPSCNLDCFSSLRSRGYWLRSLCFNFQSKWTTDAVSI